MRKVIPPLKYSKKSFSRDSSEKRSRIYNFLTFYFLLVVSLSGRDTPKTSQSPWRKEESTEVKEQEGATLLDFLQNEEVPDRVSSRTMPVLWKAQSTDTEDETREEPNKYEEITINGEKSTKEKMEKKESSTETTKSPKKSDRTVEAPHFVSRDDAEAASPEVDFFKSILVILIVFHINPFSFRAQSEARGLRKGRTS